MIFDSIANEYLVAIFNIVDLNIMCSMINNSPLLKYVHK